MASLANNDSSLVIATSAIATSAIGYVIWNLFFPRVDKNAAPRASAGMLETISAFSSTDVPFFLLKLARKIRQGDPNAKVFQIPLPMPGGVYVIASADLQRQVMNDKLGDKPMAIYAQFDPPGYPSGVFTRRTDDPAWKVTRKCAAPAFSKREVDRMNAVCSKHVETWIEERLESLYVSEARAFDPSKEMTRLTFSTISEAGFEYVPTDDEFDRYTHNTNLFLKEFGMRQLANPLRAPFGWFFAEYREAVKAIQENCAYLGRMIQQYRDSPNKSPSNTLIKLLVGNETLNKNDPQMISEVATFIAGGFDTTGYTLASTLTLLAKHPEIAQKVRQAQSELEHPEKEVSEYLRCVIKESRRLLPVSSLGSSRQLSVPIKLGNYTIPAGAIFMMPQILPHRDAEVFSPDPDVFRPERWLNATKEMNESLLTFAMGNRNCIGQALAVSELDSVLPRLLTSYEFSMEEEGKLEFFLTLKYHGTRLKAKKIWTRARSISYIT